MVHAGHTLFTMQAQSMWASVLTILSSADLQVREENKNGYARFRQAKRVPG